MSFAIAMLIGGTAALAAIAKAPSDDPEVIQEDYADLREGAVPISLIRSKFASYGNIPGSFDPYLKPPTNSTQNLNEIFKNVNANIAHTAAEQALYLVRPVLGGVPISNAEQSVSIVQLPTRTSYFVPDINREINNYPLTYFDYSTYDTSELLPYMNSGMAASGASSELLKANTPVNNPFKTYENPWGPGGVLLDLWNTARQYIYGTSEGTLPKPVIFQTPQ